MSCAPQDTTQGNGDGRLTLDEWTYLLRGAKYRTYSEGQVVLDKDMGGRTVDGLLQVVTGTMRVTSALSHPTWRPNSRSSTTSCEAQ